MGKSDKSYPSLMLEGSSKDLDAASFLLFEAGCLGTEEIATSRHVAYFPRGFDVTILQTELHSHFPALLCRPAEPVSEQDWLSIWKKGFHGFALGQRFYVLPSWETPPRVERIVLRLDPERAFGTGTHDTTRLCVELIEDFVYPDASVIDAGTGTGILAMAAAQLGCQPVVAIESDPDAASCARANIRRNRLERAVRLEQCSISEAKLPAAAVVVANLNDPLLRELRSRLSSWVQPDGVMILSGLLGEQVDPFVNELPAAHHLLQHRTAGGWAAVVIRPLADA